MKARQVMMIRLSKHWAKMDHDILRSVAVHLYSFYTFLQLADQDTKFGWGVGVDKHSNEIYLVLMELDPNGKESNPQVPDLESQGFEVDLELQLEDETGDELGEGDLDPDLRDEVTRG